MQILTGAPHIVPGGEEPKNDIHVLEHRLRHVGYQERVALARDIRRRPKQQDPLAIRRRNQSFAHSTHIHEEGETAIAAEQFDTILRNRARHTAFPIRFGNDTDGKTRIDHPFDPGNLNVAPLGDIEKLTPRGKNRARTRRGS